MYVYILCGDVLPIVGFTPMAHCLPVPVWWEIASSLPSITFLTSFLILWTPTVSPQYYEMHNPNLSLHGCHSLSCCHTSWCSAVSSSALCSSDRTSELCAWDVGFYDDLIFFSVLVCIPSSVIFLAFPISAKHQAFLWDNLGIFSLWGKREHSKTCIWN